LTTPRRLIEAVEVTDNQIHIIRLKNIFDTSTVDEFEKVIKYLVAKNLYKIVVDLSHVEFISSAGWGAFTAELRKIRQNQGDIKLACMNADVYDVFLLLELDSFISAHETVDEAILSFGPFAPDAPSISADAAEPAIKELEAAGSDGYHDNITKSSPESDPFGEGLVSTTAQDVTTDESAEDVDDEFEPQDIRDTWVLHEIDTLPEENAIEEDELAQEAFPEVASKSIPDHAEGSSQVVAISSEPRGMEEAKIKPEMESQIEFGARVETEPPMAIVSPRIDRATESTEETVVSSSPFATDFEALRSSTGDEKALAVVERKSEQQRSPASSESKIKYSSAIEKAVPSPDSAPQTIPPKMQMDGNLVEMIVRIVREHPHYGPTMIRKFLEVRVEPPVLTSRSTVYRRLYQANLNTRAKRLEYAGQAINL
jgi:anti-sigma B factor antagonist